MPTYKLEILVEGQDRASGPLGHVASALGGLGSAALSLALPVGAAGAAGVGMGIALNASAEQTSMAFTTLLGSGEAAKGFLDDLRAFSAATPFEFPELADSSRKLLAFGFAAEEIIPMMTNIGDAVGALGGGSAEINRVTMALGQMQAKGKVSAEEMMQLAELGIPAWQMLADSMGLSVAEVMKLSEKGLIPASQAIPALLSGMEQTFGGAMQGQATTFNGLLSTLKDNASMALMAFTGPLFEQAKGGLEQLGAAASSPAFQQFAADMGQQVGAALAWLTGTGIPAAREGLTWLAGVWATISPGVQQFADLIGAGLREGLAWLTATGIPAAQGGLDQLRPLLDGVLAALSPVIASFQEGGLGGALAAVPGAILPTIGSLSDLRNQLVALALEGVAGLTDQLADSEGFAAFLGQLGLSEGAIASVQGVLGSLSDGLRTVGGWVAGVGGWLQTDLLPPVIAAGRGFAEMLLPHLERLAAFGTQHVMPFLEDIGGFLAANLPGAIGVLAPLLTGLVDLGLSVVELALMGIATTWETWLRPALEALGQWLGDLTGGWDNLARGAQALMGILGEVAQAIRDIADGRVDFGQIFQGLQNLAAGTIPGFAGGVRGFRGGLALVGERGPELVALPGGADVYSAGETGRMLSGGGGGGEAASQAGPSLTVYVQGSVISERDLTQRIRDQLYELQRLNGTTSII